MKLFFRIVGFPIRVIGGLPILFFVAVECSISLDYCDAEPFKDIFFWMFTGERR